MKFVIDRIEDGVCVVLYYDSGKVASSVPAKQFDGLTEGDIFTAEYSASSEKPVFSDVVYLKDETEQRREEMRRRLERLFGRK